MAGDRETAVQVFNVKRLKVDIIGTNEGTLVLENSITINDALNIILKTTTGTSFGTSDDQKLSFHGVTPIVRAVLATGSTNDQIITALQVLGLVKQS